MKSNNPMYACPKFKHCSAPVCPLDRNKDKSIKLPGEATCKLNKTKRLALGTELLWKGLTAKELAGAKIWKNRSEKSRSMTLEKLTSRAPEIEFGSEMERPNLK